MANDPSVRDPRKCKGKSSRTGNPCGRYPSKGSAVCTSHGAAAPQVKSAAARRAAENEIRAALRDRKLADAAPVTDPFTELERLAGEVVLWKDKLGALVDELSEERYTVDSVFGETISAKIKLFRAAIQDCAAVLSVMAKLNIDERRLKVDEMTSQIVLRALDEGLKAAGVGGPAALQAKVVAAKVMKAEVSLVA